jgi:hypothetical protein
MSSKPRTQSFKLASPAMKRVFRTLTGVVLIATIAKRGRRAHKVYVEEVSSGSKPIEAVGTSIAAFIGLAPLPP